MQGSQLGERNFLFMGLFTKYLKEICGFIYDQHFSFQLFFQKWLDKTPSFTIGIWESCQWFTIRQCFSSSILFLNRL